MEGGAPELGRLTSETVPYCWGTNLCSSSDLQPAAWSEHSVLIPVHPRRRPDGTRADWRGRGRGREREAPSREERDRQWHATVTRQDHLWDSTQLCNGLGPTLPTDHMSTNRAAVEDIRASQFTMLATYIREADHRRSEMTGTAPSIDTRDDGGGAHCCGGGR